MFTLSEYIKFATKAAFFLCTIQVSFGQTIPLKAVFYRPAKASFWAELADDTGPQPTPRKLALETINQNFYGISVNTHANAVVVYIIDEDTYPSNFGGGFTYDPINRKKPQFAVAQELLVTVAAHYNLKVIFELLFSPFHLNDVTQGTDLFGSTGTKVDPQGAYGFIHAAIGPTPFYGFPSTTELMATLGLPDHPIRDFIGDSRIAGWYLGGEWDFTNQTVLAGASVPLGTAQKDAFEKYWPFFYTLVHYNGANNQFAGVYPVSAPNLSPDSPTCDSSRLGTDKSNATGATSVSPYAEIEALKNVFLKNPSYNRPDLYSVEWYGGSSWNKLTLTLSGPPAGYRTTCIKSDLQAIVRHMRDFGYPVPTAKIGVHEGGTDYAVNPLPNQHYDAYAEQFYTDAINGAANVDGLSVGEFAVWNSDGDINIGGCSTGDEDTLPITALDHGFESFSALYTNLSISSSGCRTYPAPSVGWHYGNTLVYSSFATEYGLLYYNDSTEKGRVVASGFNSHR